MLLENAKQQQKENLLYEIRYRWINSLFISLYSFINLNKSHIFVLFRYINPCTYI